MHHRKRSNVDMPLQPDISRRRSGTIDDQHLLSWTREDREAAAAFTHNDPWRVLRILGEFVAGFDAGRAEDRSTCDSTAVILAHGLESPVLNNFMIQTTQDREITKALFEID